MVVDLIQRLQNPRCHSMVDIINKTNRTGLDATKIYNNLAASPIVNAILKHRIAHDLSADATDGIAELSNIVLMGSTGSTIGRQLVRVIPTMAENVKVRKTRVGLAVNTSRAQTGSSTGQRNEYITLTPESEFEASDKWDRNYLEDADYSIATEEAAALGIAHDKAETKGIIKFLEDIDADKLAGGKEVAPVTAGSFGFSDIVNLWNTVMREDYEPTVIAMHPDQLSQIMKSQDFKDQTILGNFVDVGMGMFGRLILGLDVIASSLMTPGQIFCLDPMSAALYAIRRDKLMNTFQPDMDEFEMKVSTRYDLQEGRTETFARMTIGS